MIVEANASTTVTINGKQYLYFGGTNYLGLAHRPQLIQAASAAFEQFGFSAGASRVTSGENTLIISLEKELSEFTDAQDAVVLPAGFMSNAVIVDALEAQVDAWVVQTHAHASIPAAVSKSRKPVIVDDFVLDPALPTFQRKHKLPKHYKLAIFAEPINPISGELLDIGVFEQCTGKDDYLVLDEAHSFGVLGKRGAGAIEHFNLKRRPNLITTGTFSKALGSYGGFIIASTAIIAAIKENSNAYKASTALPPIVCAAARQSLRLLNQDPSSTIEALRKNLQYLNGKLSQLGFPGFENNVVPIYHLNKSPDVIKLSEALPDHGICIPALTNYFTTDSSIGLRWTIQAGHSLEELDRLVAIMAKMLTSTT